MTEYEKIHQEYEKNRLAMIAKAEACVQRVQEIKEYILKTCKEANDMIAQVELDIHRMQLGRDGFYYIPQALSERTIASVGRGSCELGGLIYKK